MSSIRDLIAAADDSSYEDVEIPAWGVTIRVVPPTVATRSRLLQSFPNDADEVDFDAVTVSVLVAACRDPETGEPVFTDADRDLILSLKAATVQPLFEKCQKAAGLDANTAVEEGKGGSS